MSNSRLVAAVDIGESKCVVLLGRKSDSGTEILGCGVQALHAAIRNGFIIDINAVSKAVESALHSARLTANKLNQEIALALVSISAPLCSSKEVEEDLSPEAQIISKQDTEQLISLIYKREAQNSEKSASNEVIHVLPLSYSVDDLQELVNPCGQIGSKLTVRAHLIAARPLALKNIKACLQSCGCNRVEMVLEQLASAHSVLRPRDYDFGQVALIDIGAETTKVAILKQPTEPIYTGFLAADSRDERQLYGGKGLTAQLQALFNLSPHKAEELKLFHGSARQDSAGSAYIAVPPVLEYEEDRLIAREELAGCCQAFYENIISDLFANTPIMKKTDNFDVRTLVFTGGASAIEGLYDLARKHPELENLRVRIAGPQFRGREHPTLLEHPKYATAVGLLHFTPDSINEQDLDLLTSVYIDNPHSEVKRSSIGGNLSGQLQDLWQKTRDKLTQRAS